MRGSSQGCGLTRRVILPATALAVIVEMLNSAIEVGLRDFGNREARLMIRDT